MNLDVKYLRSLLRVLADANVSSFSYEDADVKIKIVRGESGPSTGEPVTDDVAPSQPPKDEG